MRWNIVLRYLLMGPLLGGIIQVLKFPFMETFGQFALTLAVSYPLGVIPALCSGLYVGQKNFYYTRKRFFYYLFIAFVTAAITPLFLSFKRCVFGDASCTMDHFATQTMLAGAWSIMTVFILVALAMHALLRDRIYAPADSSNTSLPLASA